MKKYLVIGIIAFMLVGFLPLLTTTQPIVLAQTPKFDVTLEIDDRYMTHKTLYITVTNLQDSSDFITMKTILSATDFPIFDVTGVDFAIEQLETYQEDVPDYDNVLYEIPTFDSDNNFIGYVDEWKWEIVGWHSEEKERLVWKSKALVNKTEDGLKGELKNQWEEVPIQKAGQRKDTLRFKFTFHHPIVKRDDGWGSKGIISLDLNGETFVDLTNSSWWDSNWIYKRQIEIDSSKVENENFANFPILIETTLDNAKTIDNGDDIAFANSAENVQLSHEIESFGTENLIAWVKIPTLYDNENTIIYMYYGNASAGNQENVAGVWDDNFKGVYHLSEDPTGTIYDSTSNDYDGASYGTMTSYNQVDGQINGSLEFDGTDDAIGFPSWLNFQPRMFEAWVNFDTAGDRETIAGSVRTHIAWEESASPDEITGRYYDGSYTELKYAASTGTWYYVALVIPSSGGTAQLYVDGENRASGSVGTLNDGSYTYLGIGASGSTSQGAFFYYMDGRVDEVRISNVARSAGWIITTFNNENDPASFYSVEVEELRKITITGISVDNDLIDRVQDDINSSAEIDTRVTVRVYNNNGHDNIENVLISIRDVWDTLIIENVEIISTLIEVNENIADFYYDYNPADNLGNAQLGLFDVNVWVYDNSGENDSNDWGDDGANLFTVDDDTTTFNFNPTNPYYWWEENVSGEISRIVGTASADNVWFKDNIYDEWWYISSENDWSNNYIVNVRPGENVKVTIRVYDPPLDGLITSSYVVNENWQFQLNLRWEDNFEYVDDNTVENVKNWWVEFWFADYETQEVQLTATSNLVITAYESDTLRVTDRDENYYRTYRTNRENIDVFMVADNSLPLLTAYLLSLDDPSTRWGPLNDGAIMIYKLIENEVAYINDSYWMATSDVSLYMIRPDVYNVRLEAPGLITLDYGRLDADINTSKIISPGLGLAEYGVETINIHYMVTVRYWTTEDNHLMILYQDNYEETNWVRFIIRNVDGDVLWETLVEDTNEYTAEFTEIDIDNIYDIGIRFDHDTYGAVRRSFIYLPYYYSESVVPSVPSSSPGGLDILGDPPVPWGYLITFTILMLVLVSFGPGHSGIAVLATAMVGALFNLTEMIVIGWELIFFLIVIGILTQIFEARKGGRLT